MAALALSVADSIVGGTIGGPPGAIRARIQQISDTVGRGAAWEAIL
ncbi:hypothetical protein [Falsiroseomonas sp.]